MRMCLSYRRKIELRRVDDHKGGYRMNIVIKTFVIILLKRGPIKDLTC